MLANRGLALSDLQGRGVSKARLCPNLLPIENVPQSCMILSGTRAVTLKRTQFTAPIVSSIHDRTPARRAIAQCVDVGEW